MKEIVQSLLTDAELTAAYNNKEGHIYFREMGDANYLLMEGHSLEDALDATCHGFEFVFRAGEAVQTINEADIDTVPYEDVYEVDKEIEVELEDV